MKKKLEAELISIAHRILKLKNKSELAQLQQETLKLYEKISVLRFVEENFSEVKPTIGFASAEKQLDAIFEAKEATETISKNEPKEIQVEAEVAHETSIQVGADHEAEEVLEAENEEEIVSEVETELTEEAEDEVTDEKELVEETADEKVEVEDEIIEEETIIKEEPKIEFAPLFEIAEDEKPEAVVPKQITLEDFLTEGHVEPIFVRAEQVYSNETTTTQKNAANEMETVTKVEVVETKKTQFIVDYHEPKTVSLNDSLSKSINIGLNDRIGFEKHLFGGSGEDLNRVLSQLSTYANFGEAKEFIEDMVKPDYNNWAGKEDYETRFMEIVEKKFS
jgi:hypothetical protein